MPTPASLSCPPPFGDYLPPTPGQDAKAFLLEALRLIRVEAGPKVALMASEAIGVLSDNDSMRGVDLERAIIDSLETRMLERGPVQRALQELAIRNVITEADGRFALNPALAALIGRDAS